MRFLNNAFRPSDVFKRDYNKELLVFIPVMEMKITWLVEHCRIKKDFYYFWIFLHIFYHHASFSAPILNVQLAGPEHDVLKTSLLFFFFFSSLDTKTLFCESSLRASGAGGKSWHLAGGDLKAPCRTR